MNFSKSASSVVTTERAERLAKQFLSHWARHTPPEPDAAGISTRCQKTPDRPAAAGRVEAQAECLLLTTWADERAHLAATCDSIAEHRHRFAGKHESLTIDWAPQEEDE